MAIKTNLRNLTCVGPGSGQDNEEEDRLYDRGVCRPLFGTNQIANRGVSIAALFFFRLLELASSTEGREEALVNGFSIARWCVQQSVGNLIVFGVLKKGWTMLPGGIG